MSDDASVKDKAGNAAETGKEKAGEVVSAATDRAQDVAHEATDRARDLAGEARNQVRSQAGEQHANAVRNLRSLGDELRGMAGNGDDDNQSGLAHDLARQAGERAHGVAEWLDGRQPEEILDEVRRFARRRPGTFLVASLAAGVVAGRLTRGVVAEHQDGSPHTATGSSTGAVGSSTSGRHEAGPGDDVPLLPASESVRPLPGDDATGATTGATTGVSGGYGGAL